MKKILSALWALFCLAALAAGIGLAIVPSAFAQTVPNQAVLSWGAPTAHVDGTAITGAVSYNVYQGVGTGGTKTKVATVTAATSTINVGLLSNTTYCWEVTAFEGASGPESARSNEACKTFPASPPAKVTLTVQ